MCTHPASVHQIYGIATSLDQIFTNLFFTKIPLTNINKKHLGTLEKMQRTQNVDAFPVCFAEMASGMAEIRDLLKLDTRTAL